MKVDQKVKDQMEVEDLDLVERLGLMWLGKKRLSCTWET